MRAREEQKAGLSGVSDGPAAVLRLWEGRSEISVFLAPGSGGFRTDNAAVCGVYGDQNGVEEGAAGGGGGLRRIGGAAQKPGWAGV